MNDLELIGKYDIRGVLGEGSGGIVYDAWDPRIDRRVAIKTLHFRQDAGEARAKAMARFKQEARAAGGLANRHIVGVYDYGETEISPYIVMEFVEGRTLKARLEEAGALTPAEAGRIMQQVLEGLAYSHAHGVIHRDIKPANIILAAGGEVKIADFGVARMENSELTMDGMMIGTPSYMAPEQFLCDAVDARCDLYAAGVTLFQMLTGAKPYDGTMTAIMHRVLDTEVAPPRATERRADISPLLDAAVAKAMAKRMADRFADADAFSLALRIALEVPVQPAYGAEGDETLVDGHAPKPFAVRPASGAAIRATTATVTPVGAAPRGARSALILPGALAMLLLLIGAGGVTWFVGVRVSPAPQAPEPPAASTPAKTAVLPSPVRDAAPLRLPEEIQREVATALAALPCVRATLEPKAGGGVAVHAIAGRDVAVPARDAARAAAAGAPIDWDTDVFDGPYCPIVDLAAREMTDGAVKVGLAGDARLLRDGDDIMPQVTSPGFTAYMRVDDFALDGTVLHFPLPRHGNMALSPGSLLQLGQLHIAQVGSPFGDDMILAIGASSALPIRPNAVEKATAYLSALQAAIADIRKKGGHVAGGLFVVRTTAK